MTKLEELRKLAEAATKGGCPVCKALDAFDEFNKVAV